MQINIRLTGTAVLIAAVIFVVAPWNWHPFGQPPPTLPPNNSAPTVPTVISTGGGALLVATVKATETFIKTDPKTFLGIPLGTTTSKVQAVVTYRYHITMENQWPVDVRGKTAVVHAPKIEPTLPAAFDTATLKKETTSGWARFNKDENLDALERSITQQIQERASSPQYNQIVTDASRVTVQTFVRTWLLAGHKWGPEPEYKVIVLFPGETMPTNRLDPAAQQ